MMQSFLLYDTFSQNKILFKPIKDKHINLYVCGVTVYDYCHLGHARVFVAFDMMVRYWRSQGWTVNFVRNITDIDDKIIAKAQAEKISIQALTSRFIEAMHEDIADLGLIKPDLEPLATEAVPIMIRMIEQLILKGAAYASKNGDVYFSVAAYPAYGELSRQQLDQLRVGARVEASELKHDPLDFVLWKRAKEGEPSWTSPWGAGRPGWHIECSAMCTHHLGASIDIHGGGHDLQFPHHENERAQSESANGQVFSNYWMHVGFLQINKEKMSKSLGNFLTIREMLEKFHPEVIRLFLIQTHYRSPLAFDLASLEATRSALNRLYEALRGLDLKVIHPADDKYSERFHEAMHADFNTPLALSVLFELAKEIFLLKEQQDELAIAYGANLLKLANSIGLLTSCVEAYFHELGPGLERTSEWIEAKIAERLAARAIKNFALADQLRAELLEKGIILEDSGQGTVWRKA